jgi:hypothetical protein
MNDQSGWQADPTGRHQERYFRPNGIPTNHVRDDGIESTDEDRSESATTQADQPRVIARRISPSSSPSSRSEVTHPQARSDDAQRVLVTRYAAPADTDRTPDARPQQTEAVVDQQALHWVDRRPWWLIATICLLVALLIAASFFAIRQHEEANTWMTRYHAEVTDYHSEVHKSSSLFVLLVASQQRVMAVTNQKNMACLVLESMTRDPVRLATAGCTE